MLLGASIMTKYQAFAPSCLCGYPTTSIQDMGNSFFYFTWGSNLGPLACEPSTLPQNQRYYRNKLS